MNSRATPTNSRDFDIACKRFDHITYETVGIDPPTFYSGKFAGGPGVFDYLSVPQNLYDIEFDRARFLAREVRGGRILDVGCGSAPYAATIRAMHPSATIIGIDLDPSCVSVAKKVYDDAFTFSLGQPLPFEDESFDAVFSCDVFGHIEFMHKDAVISDIWRVTKAGGVSAHVIESGFIDYDTVVDGKDDATLRYIWMEGHIGLEPANILQHRWAKCFDRVTVENAFIYPLATLNTYEADPNLPEPLRNYFHALNPEARQAAHVALGYACSTLRNDLRRLSPELLFPDNRSGNPIQRSCGLAYLLASKR